MLSVNQKSCVIQHVLIPIDLTLYVELNSTKIMYEKKEREVIEKSNSLVVSVSVSL